MNRTAILVNANLKFVLLGAFDVIAFGRVADMFIQRISSIVLLACICFFGVLFYFFCWCFLFFVQQISGSIFQLG